MFFVSQTRTKVACAKIERSCRSLQGVIPMVLMGYGGSTYCHVAYFSLAITKSSCLFCRLALATCMRIGSPSWYL